MLQCKVKRRFFAGVLAAVFFLSQSGCGTRGNVPNRTFDKRIKDASLSDSLIGDSSAGETEEEADLDENPFKKEQSAEEQWVSECMRKMTLEEKICQLFFISPEALTGYKKVTAAGETVKKSLEKYPVGGIIFFSGNLQNESQTRQMLRNMFAYAQEQQGIPIFLGVDEEGGRVARVGGSAGFSVKKVLAMGQIGQSGNPDEAYEAGEVIGTYLSDLGFNLDFAPDADVLSNPDNTVIGDRSFGSEPQMVSEMVLEFSNGLSEHQIIPCIKHFPGHGGTAEDTHNGFAYTEKKKEELMECELIPFAKAAENQLPMIMASHISAPKVTGDNTPASLSYQMITELLRNEIGYDGIVITDALEMGAITKYYGIKEAAVLALEAGCDMLLTSVEFPAAYQAVYDAVMAGRISTEKIDASVQRILHVKYRNKNFE